MDRKGSRNPLLASGNIRRSSFAWNLLSASANSFQTMLLLIVITRFGTDTDSAAFVMAYAAGNLFFNIGKYGVRQFQVTDSTEQYSFHDYTAARWVSLAAMAVAVMIYVLSGILFREYSTVKSTVITLICLYKGIEAAEDVFHGRMQQQGRLDVAGRILFFRIFSFVLCYAVLFILTKSILLSTAAATLLAAILAIVLNRSVWPAFSSRSAGGAGALQLLRSCAPLCLTMILNMYLTNAPKFIIDGRVSDTLQTRFGIIYMPVFVLALLGNFIYQPELKSIGEARNERQISAVQKKMLLLTLLTLAVTVPVLLAAACFGIPVLEFIYHTPLASLRTQLILFILCGSLIALSNLYVMILVAFRRQIALIMIYLFSSLLLFLPGSYVLDNWKIPGLTLFFMAVLACHTLLLAFLACRTLIAEKNKKTETA